MAVRAGQAALAALVVLALAAPARAEIYELFPSNKQGPQGGFSPVLEVWIGRGRVVELRADRGDIDARAVRDPGRAIAHVVGQFGLSPARDRVFYCPTGFVRVACHMPMDRGDPVWQQQRVTLWP
jgi:hypothetical protein